MTESKCEKMVICAFTACEPAKRPMTNEFRATMGIAQLTLAQSRNNMSEFMPNGAADDLSIGKMHDDDASNGSKTTNINIEVSHPNRTKLLSKAMPLLVVSCLTPPKFFSHWLIHTSGIRNRDPGDLIIGSIHPMSSAFRTVGTRGIWLFPLW
jgi:hypothetical protein